MSAPKKWDVFMLSFVCIELPGDIDPYSEEGRAMLYRKATELYADRLRTDQCEFDWEEFDDG